MAQQGLSDHEKARYEWQIDTPGFGIDGQEKLKRASVLISRVGGVGSVVAYELAAAGVGRLILAHGGDIKPSDLNRQLLMTHDRLGTPRIDSITTRLRDLNPHIDLIPVGSNINENNAAELVGMADVVVDCAPLFQEPLPHESRSCTTTKSARGNRYVRHGRTTDYNHSRRNPLP